MSRDAPHPIHLWHPRFKSSLRPGSVSHFFFSFFTDAHSLKPRYSPLLACCTAQPCYLPLIQRGMPLLPNAMLQAYSCGFSFTGVFTVGNLSSSPDGIPAEAAGHVRYFPRFSRAFLKPLQGISSGGRSNLSWKERPLFMFTFTEVEKVHSGFDVGISDVLGPLVPDILLRLCFGNIVFILSFWDNLSLPPPTAFTILICGS